ncbi:hypothetical protein ACTMU2_32950 [Cupriavidus basilensis]
MPAPGKDTALALRTIDAALAHEEVPGTILFLTDGVESAATRAFKAQADSGRSQPVMLAVGTERGGPLRSGTDSFVEKDGVRVFARMDVARSSALATTPACPLRPSCPTAMTTSPGCSATCSRIWRRNSRRRTRAGRMKAGG